MTTTPSKFWTKLGQQHAQELRDHGFDSVKRVHALRYFTWRWDPRRVLKSEQLRFLIEHTSPRTWAEAAVTPIVASAAAWTPVDWSLQQRWLYTFSNRLLWDYAARHGAPEVTALAEPERGSPLPVRWRGRLISQDLANTALEVAAMRRALDGRRPRRILEVGAGYGRTGHALLSVFPDAAYTIVDIEPALSISRWYLGGLFPDRELAFLTPDQSDQARGVDLAVSISSLHEMTHEQIAGYLGLFDRAAAGGTVYLKQWHEWTNPDDQIVARFADYPFPARWRRLFLERAPVQTRFDQAAWRIP